MNDPESETRFVQELARMADRIKERHDENVLILAAISLLASIASVAFFFLQR